MRDVRHRRHHLGAFRKDGDATVRPSPAKRGDRTAPVRGVGRVLINNASFTDLEEGRLPEKTLTEKQNALLDWMAFESRKNSKSQYGAKVQVDQTFDYPVAYCHDLRDGNADEWNLVMQPLLKRGLIEVSDNSKGLLRLGLLTERLEARIVAVFGRGPLAPPARGILTSLP